MALFFYFPMQFERNLKVERSVLKNDGFYG
ncbi:Uncharacterised protein [Halioglobus japonicus]|nr:Uncharacterised protein [Halioglobus japonicus]